MCKLTIVDKSGDLVLNMWMDAFVWCLSKITERFHP